MSLPKVTILYANGNLLQDIAALDGIAALVGSGSTPGLIGTPKTVYNLTDAEDQGFTEEDEPVAHRHIKEFYQEVGGNQELHVMLVSDTMTMSEMLDDTEVSGAKKVLNDADGRCRLLGVFRDPDATYDPGAEFFDSDVSDALLTSKTFAQARLAELAPVRILIEGRIANPDVANTLSPKESSNGFAGVVAGGSLSDGSASIGTALGRAVQHGAEIKIGKKSNGPLALTECYIGDKTIKEMQNLGSLATFHGEGIISFMTHPQSAGYYFGVDRMASDDDYRLLAYGRIVDKAAIIAAAVYIEDLESEVEIDSDGNIDSLELADMEERIAQQINVSMGSQISAIEVYINPAQDLINTGKLTVKLRVRPLGYTTFIDVDLGLTAPSSN